MKNHKIAKIALTVLFATQLISAEASVGSKFKETILSTKNEILNNPYFQFQKPIIRELTEEEAMEFINDEPETGLITKILSIPPRPSEGFDLRDLNFGNNDVSTSKPTRLAKSAGKVRTTLDPVSNANNVIMMIDKLVAIGQKILPIIDKGRPVVTNSPMAAISVVPKALSKEHVDGTMENWSLPLTRHYTISYPNGVGIIVAKFVYSVTFQHSGTYNGRGRFLTGIRSAAKKIDVVYGFNLDAKSRLIQISNIGKNGNVVAGAMIEMEYTVKNFSRSITNVDSFFLTGDGRIIQQ